MQEAAFLSRPPHNRRLYLVRIKIQMHMNRLGPTERTTGERDNRLGTPLRDHADLRARKNTPARLTGNKTLNIRDADTRRSNPRGNECETHRRKCFRRNLRERKLRV